MQLGHPAEEVAQHHRALALSPRNPLTANWAFSIGRALHLMNLDAEAIPWFRRARRDNPLFLPAVTETLIAVTCANTGDTVAARTALAEAGRLDSDPMAAACRWVVARSDHPRYQHLIGRTHGGLADLETLRANDDETSSPREFSLEGAEG